MSRTKRRQRKTARFDLEGTPAEKKINSDGTVRDGSPTRPSTLCENHGSCPYCEANRQHSTERRKPTGSDEA